MSEKSIAVRWATTGDGEAIAGLMQMNGHPRWEAFEDRFVVAEIDGRVFAAMSYGKADGEVRVGRIVTDPWGGERELSVALYRGMVGLATELGASGVLVEGARRGEYLVEAGYSHGLRGWSARAGGERVPRSRPAFRERLSRAFGRTSVPGV